jgi:WD40 repeat protein
MNEQDNEQSSKKPSFPLTNIGYLIGQFGSRRKFPLSRLLRVSLICILLVNSIGSWIYFQYLFDSHVNYAVPNFVSYFGFGIHTTSQTANSPTVRIFYRGYSSSILGVAWSPDGKHIASASADQTVQVWDAVTGSTLLTFYGHTAGVNAVAWSPDGKHIASASDDKTVQVWDAVTGSTLLTYRGHTAGVNAVAWSPDGKHIVSVSNDRTIQVLDASY